MMNTDSLEYILEENFLEYSAYVLQRRALPDARDGMKYTARQILHAQAREKLDCNHKFKKSQKSVSAATSFSYVHGNSSCYEQIMRMGRNLVQRYKLEEVKGNSGQPNSANSYSAERYTESRLSPLSMQLMKYMEMGTLDASDWSPTYDEEGQFPTVFPSVGFYGLCNGSFGSIGVGLISSIPQFNLKEMNEVLANLIDNPNAEFVLLPDFASGAILLNPHTTQKSLERGEGKSALLRAHIKKHKGEGFLEILDLPYGVYTNTICAELAKALEKGKPPFTDFKDLSQAGVQIRVYSKELDKLEDWLYKNTSVQKYFTIKMTMLNGGKTPKLFTLREALLAHIAHTKKIYRRQFEFEKRGLLDRAHILEGLIRAYSILDDIISVIRGSKGRADSIRTLVEKWEFSEAQATAIVDLRLHRLSNLDVEAVQKEYEANQQRRDEIDDILTNEHKFNDLLKGEYVQVANQYGDARKTEITTADNWETGQDDEGAEKTFYVSPRFKDGYVATYNADDEVFEDNVVPPTGFEPDQEYIFITNKLRGFTRKGNEFMMGEHPWHDLLAVADDEYVISLGPKDLYDQLDWFYFKDVDENAYKLHSSYIVSGASKRGKRLTTRKYEAIGEVIILDDTSGISQVR